MDASVMRSCNPLKLFTFIFVLSSLRLANCAEVEDSSQPEVWFPQGTILGTTVTTRFDRNVSAFLGIPYAQPPVGDLRFANPMANYWNGTLNATKDGNMCPQAFGSFVAGNEDCLYLNVYAPQGVTNSSSLPVMVYIHGGAFQFGSSSSASRGPYFLMQTEDIILVAGNYRVGLLGFLSTGDEVASGNWGLKDQVLALKWVQDNIRYFGGDPDQVTVFGESAAGASIHLLSLSDATIGLFHRYITQSGSGLGTWAYRPRAAYASRASEIGEYVGCSNDTSEILIGCLRTLNTSYLLAMDSQFPTWETVANIIWGPTDEPDIEGAILTDSPSNLLEAGKVRDLPWITGVVQDEGLLLSRGFHEDEDSFEDFLQNFETRVPVLLCWSYESDSGAAWLKAVRQYYFNNDLTANRSELLANLTILVSDSQFFYPLHRAAQRQLELAKSPTYVYTFNFRGTYTGSDAYNQESSQDYGVAHADELLYLFLNPSLTNYSATDYEMVDTMIGLWTSFAINGTPSTSVGDGSITWDSYSTSDNYLRIGNRSDPALEMQYSFFAERMQFWASLESNSAVIHPVSFLALLLPGLIFLLSSNEY